MTNTNLCPKIGLYDYRRFIADDKLSVKLIRRIRWPKGVICPKCRSRKIWHKGSGRNYRDYQCASCKHHFSDFSGTFFAQTHLSISKWIIAIALWRLGISAVDLQWAIGVAYRHARNMLRKLRQIAGDDRLFQRLQGIIEADDAYYGGRRKGHRGRGAAGKTPVIGLRERGGRVKTMVVPNLKKETIAVVMKKYVRPGSLIITDEFRPYKIISKIGFKHKSVNHSENFIDPSDPTIHTQTAENIWSITKPITFAQHRKLSPQHLQEYLYENDFMFNERDNADFVLTVLEKLIFAI